MTQPPTNSDRKRRQMRVVAALIRAEREVLLTQRKPGRHLGLSWEFPGGKVEAGETDEEALIRELQEELGLEVTVGTRCFETRHNYGHREMHLLIYRCRIENGTPEALDVNAFEWVHEEKLLDRRFLPADMPLVRGLAAGLVAHDDEDDSGAAAGQPAEATQSSEDPDDQPLPFKPAKVVRLPTKTAAGGSGN